MNHLAEAGVVGRRLPRVALGQAQPRRPRVGELGRRELGRQLRLHVPGVVVTLREAQLLRFVAFSFQERGRRARQWT